MKFEHLIEINDPLNPLIDTLTREQVWRGLVLCAEMPKLFVPHLDECTIDERESGSFRRSRRFGELVVIDRVLLTPLQEVRYEVPEQGEIAASSLTVTIETPAEHTMFVRFKYDDGHDAETDKANAMYDEYKKSAYQEADIDTIRIVREMAQAGRLDASYLN
ncbi:SRPBCC family protein [Massilia scottii]|uniref:SRPBCC family protein n=1 Tax=Massilia scottii TaxID=3057166 RepID=UPI0027967ACB|nr:SRPBCC family protein [Massilia sp. CCM 9029]MDQ1830868.1 SRPBCC family protein [Massilia sp. CCM 9029]